MKSTIIALFVGVVLLSYAAKTPSNIHSPEKISSGQSLQEINSLLMAPLKNIGQSRESARAKVGPWISSKTKTIANRHDADKIDNIYTLKYDGLILEIYEAVEWKKEMLLSVRMTQNQPRILPALIGSKREAIGSRFGPSEQTNSEELKYSVEDEIGKHSVIFKLHNNIVVNIQWSYYLD